MLLFFSSRFPGRESDEESDEIPSDVDLSDPFFSQEIHAGVKNSDKGDKTSGKTRKKRKRAGVETEEDKKERVQCFFRKYILIM